MGFDIHIIRIVCNSYGLKGEIKNILIYEAPHDFLSTNGEDKSTNKSFYERKAIGDFNIIG